MRILIAEDDPVSRRVLQASLVKWGHEVICTENGAEAYQTLESDTSVRLAILDWMMPELDGVDVCRRLRQRPSEHYVHVILLTAKGQKDDIVGGLEAGADDYVTKPFDRAELRSRIQVGERLVKLQVELNNKVRDLEAAMAHVKQLQGLLPICMHCKKIRDDTRSWRNVESYIADHSGATFSHGICDSCMAAYHPE